MSNTPNYTNVAGIVREARKRKYKTAKEYWEEHQEVLNVSYPHDSSIENGSKFPDIRLTIAIAKTLKIELRLICHVWAKDQMPDPETRAFFEPIPGAEVQGIPTTIKMPLDEFYVFTETQIPILASKALIWDTLMFIMAFSESTPPTEKELAAALNARRSEMREAVDWLRNEGLVYVEKGHLKSRRSFFHLPNTEPFKHIRDLNFLRASKDTITKISSHQLASKEAYRTTFTRRMTSKQAQDISKHIDDLIGHMGNMDNVGTETYSLTIAMGPRLKFLPEAKARVS